MARTLTGGELFKLIDAVDLYRIASGETADTTTSEAIASDAADVDVVSISGFATTNSIMVDGSGGTELLAINGAPASSTITFATPAYFAQDSGARLVRATRVALGHVEEGGVTVNFSKTQTAINSAIADTAVAFLPGPLELSASFGLLGFNPENLQFSLGAAETVIGAGTASDPYAAGVGTSAATTQGLQVIRLGGLRHDGHRFTYDVLGATVEASGSQTMNRSTPAAFPVTIKGTGLILRTWAV